MSKPLNLLIIGILVTIFTGCATAPLVKLYEGPDKSEQEVAILSVPVVFFKRFNGFYTSSYEMSYGIRIDDKINISADRYPYAKYHLLSGNHEIMFISPINIIDTRAPRTSKINFEAKAGHQYKIDVYSGQKGLTFDPPLLKLGIFDEITKEWIATWLCPGP